MLTDEQDALNKQLEKVSWGFFFVGLGTIFAIKSIYGVEIKGGGFILIGILLIALNFIRKLNSIPLSKFTSFIGVILLLIGISDFAGFKLPLLETILILIGLFIVLGTISKRR